MKWLIFGASSFSGSHLVRYLREQRHEVEERNLREAEPVLPLPKVDVVINFAALNVVAPSWAHWNHYMRVNVQRTGTLFDALRDNQPGLYIHVSTPEVYGRCLPQRHGDQEYQRMSGLHESQPFDPSTPYAVSRAASEMLLKTYERQYGLKAIVTRACNVYGPGQQHYRLVPKLVACIKKHMRFPLEGGGAARRSYLYVDDLCRAYDLLGRYGEPGQAYHIAPPGVHSPGVHSTVDVANRVCRQMNAKPYDVLHETPERPGKDPEYWLDASRISRMGWAPNVSLDDGIGRTWNWMERNWETIKDNPMEYEVRP